MKGMKFGEAPPPASTMLLIECNKWRFSLPVSKECLRLSKLTVIDPTRFSVGTHKQKEVLVCDGNRIETLAPEESCWARRSRNKLARKVSLEFRAFSYCSGLVHDSLSKAPLSAWFLCFPLLVPTAKTSLANPNWKFTPVILLT